MMYKENWEETKEKFDYIKDKINRALNDEEEN